ncbi:MAG: glucokinase [Desulfocapsaceae bacterium]
MILAGDIGGTKTVLALFSEVEGIAGGVVHETRYPSNEYDSLESVIEDFLAKVELVPSIACFGVAGPVDNQTSQITNLPWQISAQSIAARFNIAKVTLINDLESIATSVPHLGNEELYTLNPGVAESRGNIAVVAPGTGLGTAFLVWTGTRYKALASEGGHTSFAPRSAEEIDLLNYLQPRYRHVSFERICSGSHLPNIYEFLLDRGSYEEPAWLGTELEQVQDRTPVIVQAGLEQKAEICTATLDMFVNILGTAISNMAITILPRGGIYLGGGIPPRILPRLKQPDFLEAVAHKGRFHDLSLKMPVHVILTPRAPLYGAALSAMEAMDT